MSSLSMFILMISAGVLYTSLTHSSVNTNAQRMRTVAIAKDSVGAMMSRYIRMPASLRNSVFSTVSDNSALKNCVVGGGSCSGEVAQNFILYGPIQGSGSLAGPFSSPIAYDWWGTRCSSVSALCPIQASVQFIAHCPGGAASCAQAESIEVSFVVQKATAIDLPGSLRMVSDIALLTINDILTKGVTP